MSRPLRIEFPGAWYHAMNRSAEFRSIFEHDEHGQLFLNLLQELDRMFRVEIHGYCLMADHYHLLMCTPAGNLQRVMRHLNGVYTQRYNRLEGTDGPLFRGRYKAVLIDADAYLLSVSRYIHLHPETAGVVRRAADYTWSSYPAYVGLVKEPPWLHTKFALSMIGQRRVRERYRAFVEAGVEEELAGFYGQKKWNPILGEGVFRDRVMAGIPQDQEIPDSRKRGRPLSMPVIVETVAESFAVNRQAIMTASRGRGSKNLARVVAIYLSRKVAGLPLNDIADFYGLQHYGSVSGVVSRFQKTLVEDQAVNRLVKRITKSLSQA